MTRRIIMVTAAQQKAAQAMIERAKRDGKEMPADMQAIAEAREHRPGDDRKLAELIKPFGFAVVEAIRAGFLDDVLPLILGAANVRQKYLRRNR